MLYCTALHCTEEYPPILYCNTCCGSVVDVVFLHKADGSTMCFIIVILPHVGVHRFVLNIVVQGFIATLIMKEV